MAATIFILFGWSFLSKTGFIPERFPYDISDLYPLRFLSSGMAVSLTCFLFKMIEDRSSKKESPHLEKEGEDESHKMKRMLKGIGTFLIRLCINLVHLYLPALLVVPIAIDFLDRLNLGSFVLAPALMYFINRKMDRQSKMKMKNGETVCNLLIAFGILTVVNSILHYFFDRKILEFQYGPASEFYLRGTAAVLFFILCIGIDQVDTVLKKRSQRQEPLP